MNKSIFRFLGLSVAVLFVMSMVYSCGSSSSSSSSTPVTPVTPVTIGPGSSFTVSVTAISQPSSLAGVLQSVIPTIAVTIVTMTTETGFTDTGSMVLYGGDAVSTSPTDIIPTGFSLALPTTWTSNYITATSSVVLSVSGISIPLQTFNISGSFDAQGNITNGTIWAVVHCVDSTCSNLNSTIASYVVPNLDANNNMNVYGTFNSALNKFSPVAWIGSGDTANTTLANGIGANISEATLEVTTTSSPLLTKSTLPYVILTTKDSNNLMNVVGQGVTISSGPFSNPVTINYNLLIPGLSGQPFTTAAGTAYDAYFMFGLTNSKTVSFTP